MIEWPEELVEDIARNNAILVLGAGVSKNSKNERGDRPPNWKEFLQGAVKKIDDNNGFISTLIDKEDFLMACELIREKDKIKFDEYALDCFSRAGYQAAEIHKHIFDLNVQFTITPNVDLIYETYAKAASHSTVIEKTYYEEDIAKYIRGKDKIIIKMHGTISNTDNMIFTHGEYANARCKYANFYTIVSALILTHTFIFIGCGLNDPDIKMLLEDVCFKYPNCRPHYFVSADMMNNDLKKSIKKNYNLEVIQYSSSDNHKELVNSLKNLTTYVEEKREEIATIKNW